MRAMRLCLAGLILIGASGVRAADGLVVDESLGKVSYDYRFDLPPARGRYQPTLALSIDSRVSPTGSPSGGTACTSYNGGFGKSWQLVVPYLVPSPDAGTYPWPSLVTRDGTQNFVAFSGAGGREAGGVAEIERGYMRFTNPGSGIEAFDAAGSRWVFGPIANQRYLLTQVVDVDGNVTKYFYNSSDRLTSILYNAYRPTDASSTASVGDTGYFATIVALEYDTMGMLMNLRVQVRADPTRVSGSLAPVTVRRYHFDYDSSEGTGNWLKLASVTEIGGESGPEQRVTTFEMYPTTGTSPPGLSCLRAVTTPLGARFEVTYASSVSFGDATANEYPLARTLAISGPALAGNAVTYWYSTPARPNGEQRGFAQSWSEEGATSVVKHTWWEVGSRAFVGWPAQVELGAQLAAGGATQPPTYSRFRQLRYEHSARSITYGTCTGIQTVNGAPAATEIGSTSYNPVTPFTQSQEEARFEGGVELRSRRTIACGDLDAWGNVKKVTVDPDVAVSGNEFLETTTYEVGFSGTATCKDCPREKKRTDTASNELEATLYEYAGTFLPTNLKRKADALTGYVQVETRSYHGNGNLASRTKDGVTWSYTYDDYYQLRVASEQASDAALVTAIITDTTYDESGRPRCASGPYYATLSPYPPPSGRPQRCFLYDALGRVRVVARQPIVGSAISEAIAAFEYADPAAGIPATAKSYTFAVPLSYTHPSIPGSSDVRQTISVVDGLGHEIQTRERLGAAASSDPAAGISQNLSGYRVAKAILLDGAGRMTASLEPYISASGAYRDLRTTAVDASKGPVQATVYTYDSQGRTTCRILRYVSSSIPAAGTCVSNFTEGTSYARAELSSYRAYTDGSGRNYWAVKVIPAENNITGAQVGAESFYDAAGLLQWTTDAEGNTARRVYDLLGRATSVVREVAGGAKAPIPMNVFLDMMGRVYRVTDLDIGRRSFKYDGANPGLLQKVVFEKTGDEIRYTYDKGRLASVKLCRAPVDQAGSSCTTDATFSYDLPYLNNSSYAYTAGRMASAWNGNTTIAFGYDEGGAMLRRDQWLPGIPNGFGTVVTSATADGRPTGMSFSPPTQLPLSGFTAQVSYDSAARAVRLASGSSTYWEAVNAADNTGAFDALERLGSARVDGARVQQTWTYGSYNALLASQSVTIPGSTNPVVYSVNQITYRGTKLAGFTDGVSGKTYGYWYSATGRLVAAQTMLSGSQTALSCLGFSVTSQFGPGPSFGNIELVREGISPPATLDYVYSGTDVEASVPPGQPHPSGPDAPTSVGLSSMSYDDYGRVVANSGTGAAFGYDLLNRMTSITASLGPSETLAYDPFGAIVYRQIGTTVVSYVGASATVTGILAAGCTTPSCGVVVSSGDVHLVAGGARVATMRLGASPRTLYLYRDRLGSVVATTLGGGAVGANYRYGPHGKVEAATGDSGDTASELGYAGALRLSGGLLLMGARVYDPTVRVFMQPDPLLPHTFTYASGDPVNRVDPTGMGDKPPKKCDAGKDCSGSPSDGWASSRGWSSGYGSTIYVNVSIRTVQSSDESSSVSVNERTGEITITYGPGEAPPEVVLGADGVLTVRGKDKYGWWVRFPIPLSVSVAPSTLALVPVSATQPQPWVTVGKAVRRGLKSMSSEPWLREVAGMTGGVVAQSTSLGEGLVMTAGDEVFVEAALLSIDGVALATKFAIGAGEGLLMTYEVLYHDEAVASLTPSVNAVLSHGR
jgi:RHS repeat-associated protein